MKKILAMLLALVMVFALVACGSKEAAPVDDGNSEAEVAFPEHAITLIVPWNAGGASDLIGRVLAEDMKTTLGVDITVVNTPGATGTVGMNDCLLNEHDGYTWIANATPYSHGFMGLADWAPSDWDYMAAYYVPSIIAVSKDSPYKTFEELYAAIEANPGTITGGTAGVGSTGYTVMEILGSVCPVMANYKPVSYEGGSAAVTATLAGEVDFTPQLSNEQIDLLRSGDLIALAAMTSEDLTLDGVDYTIPSIKNFLPEVADILPLGDAFGLMLPADVPDATKAVIEAAYLKACESDAVKAFANEKGMMLQALNMADSNALRDKTASMVGWTLFDSGVAPVSPENFGIARP